ncbi:MAG: tyrosine--tRNA ligase [bacterium]|nr:tyrosine--tRNA ligase [bacterium]
MSTQTTGSGAGVLEDLGERGLVQDTTDRQTLRALLDEPPAVLYLGIDPSASSLHLGNLIGVLVLRRFAEAGHRPLALVGGATGMVGDPSGRSDERNLLDAETLESNVTSIRRQYARFAGVAEADVVNNHDWTAPVGVIEFLRDVGKHVTVSQMLARESVRSRLGSTQGISYTEFSYMLLQAFDFWWLHTHHGCRLQVGGSDQWGNIVAGIDLIRRRSGSVAHGLTWPLLTRSDGQKFGKTAEGTVWLDSDRSLPFDLHQYLLRTDDADVGRLLAQLTLLPMAEVREITAEAARAPERRLAQQRLADEVTGFVHGAEAVSQANLAAEALYGSAPLSGEMLGALTGHEPLHATAAPTGGPAAGPLSAIVASSMVARDDLEGPEALVGLLVASGLCSSRADARRQLRQSAVSVNRTRVTRRDVAPEWLIDGRYLLLQRGRRERRLVVVEP